MYEILGLHSLQGIGSPRVLPTESEESLRRQDINYDLKGRTGEGRGLRVCRMCEKARASNMGCTFTFDHKPLANTRESYMCT